MKDNTAYRAWWEEKWREREDTLKGAFGETFPPATVIGFSWPDLDLSVPGACAMVFPPREPSRPEWLTITHGLTQPGGPEECHGEKSQSGYGYELGFLTRSHVTWCESALLQLITYIKQSGRPIDRGHRVPMWFSTEMDHEVSSHLGKAEVQNPSLSTSEMSAILFWPYMKYPRGFSTSTGFFSVLLGTLITQAEWDMAKATSTSHLLLLLFRAGIGQVSDIHRSTITINRTWELEWERIRRVSENEAGDLLLDLVFQDETSM
jgi:hypothetical protein